MFINTLYKCKASSSFFQDGTFTSPLWILEDKFPHGNIWSKYLHWSDYISFLPFNIKLSDF